ncbi:MAG: helix-turn-helix domain containing protein [Methylomonas sp.]|nr:helix-turn-helix domain containing protein [Methylomonas sp.]
MSFKSHSKHSKMINPRLNEKPLDELHTVASENPCSRARIKCRAVYLLGKGYACKEIAEVIRVDADTVTNYLRKYQG